MAGNAEGTVAGRVPLAGYYFLHFAALGITLPFLPAYLRELGLSASRIGLLLALGPAFALLAPPLWGRLADRTGRPDRVLSAVALGSTLGFSLLLGADGFGALFAAIAAYALFASSITPLADALTLQRVARVGGSYAHLRLFGSVGFVVSSTGFGLSIQRIDAAVVQIPLVLLGAAFVWSLGIRTRPGAAVGTRAHGALRLLRQRELRLLLGACCLHWIACAPYHGTFPIHVRALGLPPWVVGIAAGLGVLAEIGVMAAHPRLAARLAPRHLLLAAFLGSAVRWWALALTSHPGALIGLALLHAFSFGFFYVAAVTYLAARVPPSMRARGQGLFAAATFGIGGLVGYASSGLGYDWLGGHRLFAAAGFLELLPALLVLGLPPATSPRIPLPGERPTSEGARQAARANLGANP